MERHDGFEGETNLSHNAPSRTGRLCLLVIEEKGFVRFPLPETGEVTIGRAAKCEIPLADTNVSRKHAILRTGPSVELIDLGSLNGTRLGDRRVPANQPIELGMNEVITIGSTVMMLQISGASLRPRRLWTHGYFEARLEEECARAELGGRSFAIAHLCFNSPVQAGVVELSLAERLRPADVLACYAPGEYEIMLVEMNPTAAEAFMRHMSAEFTSEGMANRAGVACYPKDARTTEALVAHARGATERRGSTARVQPGGVLPTLRPIVERIAAGMINTILLGETGVGKEVLAETIHGLSPRAGGALLRLNCAALNESLLESELFGHERGSFTGAVGAKPGLLETAQGGTVFLDEVGEMPLTIQAKLLRVIEERQVMRVGALKPRPIDVRFVCATNRDLEMEVEAGRFRRDLFYRLNGISLVIPPLRERVGEIEGLARLFVRQACEKTRQAADLAIAPEAMELLKTYSWPGNIRELRNLIERAVLLSNGATITPEHLPREKMGPTLTVTRKSGSFVHMPQGMISSDRMDPTNADEKTNVKHVGLGESGEHQRILRALEDCAGNQTRAAKLLGISRRTLVTRLEEYGIPRPRKPPDGTH